MTRIYDRESEQAVMLPRDPTTFEPAHVAEIRDALKVQSERFVQIEPIGFQEQLDWMREFTETANSTVTQEALVTALEDGRPARAFAQVLHTDDVERARWNRFRTSRVLERMAAWGTKAGVTLQPFVSVQISRTGLTRGQAVSPASRTQHHAPALQPQSPGPLQQDRAHRLRARLHAAIDRMPESELLTLRLPVEYLIEP